MASRRLRRCWSSTHVPHLRRLEFTSASLSAGDLSAVLAHSSTAQLEALHIDGSFWTEMSAAQMQAEGTVFHALAQLRELHLSGMRAYALPRATIRSRDSL